MESIAFIGGPFAGTLHTATPPSPKNRIHVASIEEVEAVNKPDKHRPIRNGVYTHDPRTGHWIYDGYPSGKWPF